MRRRRLLASGVAALAALAGCLGSDFRRNASTAGEPSVEEWEPTATGSRTRDPGGENPTNGDGTPADGGGHGKEGSRKNGGEEAREADDGFENGATWQAEKAQVAADDPRAGAAVEFVLETAPPEPCGRTCRELRAALTNAGTGNAHDVVVDTELASGERVLRERRDVVGDLPAGETYRASERVELGVIEALRVQRNGALVVEHVVTSAERREVFRETIET